MEPWLDESIATYSEALFYEEYFPDLVPWWWENRVDNQIPGGYIDNSIYLEDGYPAYLRSIYLNGAHFYQDLRDTIGDQSFKDFLRAYIAENRYKIATPEDYWRILKENTDADLAPLINEYFANPPAFP
jgi:aminopeptidase N